MTGLCEWRAILNNKIKLGVACGFLFVVSCLGLYFAWQEGLIPTSVIRPHPRAPVPENFLGTLTSSAVVAQSLRPMCVRLNLHSGRDIDRMGRPGLQHQRVPGWDMLVIAQVPGDNGQRIGSLSQALDALVKANIYSVRDIESEDAAGGKLPAHAYTLTTAGWLSMIEEQCFKVGTPQVTEITEFSRVMPDKEGKRIYEVKARYATPDIAPWVDDPAVQTLVSPDQLKKIRESVAIGFRLLRTDTGWELEASESDAPELTKEAVLSLVAKWRNGVAPQACIRLPAKGATPGFDIVLAPYAATQFDVDTMGETDSRFYVQLQWQSRFLQLVKAGIFKEEKLAANPKLNAPSGTRYVLDSDYQPWLDMNDARCLRMGEATMEFVGMSVQKQAKREGADQSIVNATAKLMLRLAKDAWVDKVSLVLPEMEAVKDAGGVPISVRMMWNGLEKEKEWRINSVQVPSSDPLPPRIPQSVQARGALMSAASGRAPQAAPAPAPAAAAPAAVSASAPAFAPLAGGLASAGDVTWKAGGERSVNGRVSNQGLTVTYCCAGASSATLASQGVTSGKVYAEFAFAARPLALKGDTWTTIGVIPAPPNNQENSYLHVKPGTPTMAFPRGDEIAHNDVIGIAVDMDAGKLYFSRNGSWLNAQPGSGGGITLMRGQAHFIAAVLSASSSSAGTDSWTANFGKARFRYAIPRGFKSYDGRQRG
jgi:hypothetical protein